MNMIESHLQLIYKISIDAKSQFEGRTQNELTRFVYCGIGKVSKISLAFLRLYPQLEGSRSLEFPLGILSRSVLMDMILVLRIKSICATHPDNDLEKLTLEVKDFCYGAIADGTSHIIETVFSSNLNEAEKIANAKKLASLFSKAFDFSGHKPKLRKKYKYRLGEMGEKSQNPKLVTGKSVVELYEYYSKYDHLSHWTAASDQIPFEKRKDKIDLSIILMVLHLRDLLSIAYDFDEDYKNLLPYMQQISDHMDACYLKESEGNNQGGDV